MMSGVCRHAAIVPAHHGDVSIAHVVTTHLLSADHRLPGLDVVARLGAVAPGLGPDLLEAVPALRGVLVLSTCNRLTLLIDADSWADTGCPAALHPDLSPADASQSAAASDLGETITAFLAERAGLPASGLLLTHLVGAAARREMLAIAAGLSSMVVGEAQIVGQVRRAAETAAAEGTLSAELVRVVERASATARRVAHETELSGQGRSVVAVGVDQAAAHLPPLEDCRALIVGTGSYAGATVADLRARGLSDIAVYSASNRAEAFAAGHGLRAVPTGALSEAMSRADLVVTCRGTGGPILTADIVAPVAAERAGSAGGAGRPLVILDLALTRDVDEAVGALPGVVHLDLARVRDAVPEAEAQQVTAARAIVEAEAADFERTLAGPGGSRRRRGGRSPASPARPPARPGRSRRRRARRNRRQRCQQRRRCRRGLPPPSPRCRARLRGHQRDRRRAHGAPGAGRAGPAPPGRPPPPPAHRHGPPRRPGGPRGGLPSGPRARLGPGKYRREP